MTFSTQIQKFFSPTPRTNDFKLKVRNSAASQPQQNTSGPEPRAAGFFRAITKPFSRVYSHLFGGPSVQRATKRSGNTVEKSGSFEKMPGAAELKETLQAMEKKDVSQTKACLTKLQEVLGSTNPDQAMKQLVNAYLLQNGKNGANAFKLVHSVCENSPWKSVEAKSDENELQQLYSNLASTFEAEWTTMFQNPPIAWRTGSKKV